jgi:hypothetical protein
MGLDAVRDETRRTREAMLDVDLHARAAQRHAGLFQEPARQPATLDRGDRRDHAQCLTPCTSASASSTASSSPHPRASRRCATRRSSSAWRAAFNRQINTALTLVTTEKHALTQKFFETVAVQARRTFELANRDVEQWLRAVMSPLETQVREYQIQLKRRLESVKRIHEATDTLERPGPGTAASRRPARPPACPAQRTGGAHRACP